MTKINQKNIKYAICVVILIIIAYYSRSLHTEVENPIIRMILVMTRSVIQISLVIAWCSSIITRIINKQVRRYLIAVGIMLAFWLILRTCKWEFIAENGTHLGRYLWYAYYIPIVFVPLLGVFIVDHIGKAQEYKTPNRMKYLYILAVLFVVSVFTNDLHHFVFSFTNGIENCESDYCYGFMYFLTIAWSILLGIYFVVMLIKKSRVPGSKSFQKLPVIILGGAVIFWIMYCMNLVGGDLAAALTNAVRHADSKTLFVKLSENEENYSICFTNDGNKLINEIIEGGGLGALRQKTERIGGTMEVSYKSAFVLKLTVLKKRREDLC